jgi:hypothetical protein
VAVVVVVVAPLVLKATSVTLWPVYSVKVLVVVEVLRKVKVEVTGIVVVRVTAPSVTTEVEYEVVRLSVTRLVKVATVETVMVLRSSMRAARAC